MGMLKAFSEQVTESVMDVSSSGMSDVAFRTASPIGALSCLISGPRYDLKLLTPSD